MEGTQLSEEEEERGEEVAAERLMGNLYRERRGGSAKWATTRRLERECRPKGRSALEGIGHLLGNFIIFP